MIKDVTIEDFLNVFQSFLSLSIESFQFRFFACILILLNALWRTNLWSPNVFYMD